HVQQRRRTKKILWTDANNRHGMAVDGYALAGDISIAQESRLPVLPRDHYHGIRPGHAAFLRGEEPAYRRFEAEQRKEISRNKISLHRKRLALVGQTVRAGLSAGRSPK